MKSARMGWVAVGLLAGAVTVASGGCSKYGSDDSGFNAQNPRYEQGRTDEGTSQNSQSSAPTTGGMKLQRVPGRAITSQDQTKESPEKSPDPDKSEQISKPGYKNPNSTSSAPSR